MFFLVKSVFFATLLVIGSIFYTDAASPRIAGGTPAGELEAPFMVAVIENTWNQLICGGSIISKKTFISTGYGCLANYANNTKNITVLFGSNNIKSPNVQRVNLTSVLVHPNYQTIYYNLALGFVANDFVYSERVQPIPMDVTLIGGGIVATVYGWGEMENGIPGSDVLNKLNVTTMNQTDCARYHAGVVDLAEYHICTQSTFGEACRSDAGSPLVLKGKMIAVFSYSFGYCGLHVPHTHSRISHFADWIEANIKH